MAAASLSSEKLAGDSKEPDNGWYEHLKSVSAAEFLAEKKSTGKVVTLFTDTTVTDALSMLSKNRILSAPVISRKNNEVICFLDVLDMVSYYVSKLPEKNSLSDLDLRNLSLTAVGGVSHHQLTQVIEHANKNNKEKLESISVVAFRLRTHLSSIAKFFAMGLHRCLVVDENDKVKGIISQSDIIRHFARILDTDENLAEFGGATLAKIGLAHAPAYTISESATMFSALKVMRERQVKALAVIDRYTGKIKGNLSLSDLRGIANTSFLTDTVHDYLEAYSPESLKPRCIVLETSLAELVKELAAEHLHRMWVVDEDFKPTQVVTLTDIMQIVTEPPEEDEPAPSQNSK